jgi:hypothetical protein
MGLAGLQKGSKAEEERQDLTFKQDLVTLKCPVMKTSKKNGPLLVQTGR